MDKERARETRNQRQSKKARMLQNGGRKQENAYQERNILGCSEQYYEDAVLPPVFFQDLNLDQILQSIMSKRKGYDLRKYFNRLPDQVETCRFRIEFLREIMQEKQTDFGQRGEQDKSESCRRNKKKESLAEGMLDFSEKMKQAREYAAACKTAEVEIQKQRFRLDSAVPYVRAVEELRLLMELQGRQLDNIVSGAGAAENICDAETNPGTAADNVDTRKNSGGYRPLAEGLRWIKDKLDVYCAEEEYIRFREETLWLQEQAEEMRLQVAIGREKMKITTEVESVSYSKRLKKLFPKHAEDSEIIDNPFQAEKEPGEFEQQILTVFRRERPDWFRALEEFSGNYPDCEGFMAEWLLIFEQQLQVYLAFYLFHQEMAVSGYPFCFPEFQERKEISMREGYDLALLLKSMYSSQRVICNDAAYSGKERFLVVTGPNQGGKTTYARSIGQIVYFSLMGLMAPCTAVCLPFFSGLLTHFSVEESLETGRGKLKEELMRLSPMMQQEERNKFIILNELFTTAATMDACEMGSRVMEHFMEQDCFGIYVTHLQELAKEDGRIVSLCACVDKEDNHIRTYRMERKPAEGTGYAYGLVEKYHLTYPELKKRLAVNFSSNRVPKECFESGDGEDPVSGQERPIMEHSAGEQEKIILEKREETNG